MCSPINLADQVDRLLLQLNFGELVHFARQALEDVLAELSQDEPPGPGEGDILTILTRAVATLRHIAAS